MGFTSRSDFFRTMVTPVAEACSFCGAGLSISPGYRGKNCAFAMRLPAVMVMAKSSFLDRALTFQERGTGLGRRASVWAKSFAEDGFSPIALPDIGSDI